MQTLTMALRAGRPEHTPEAEPVLIDNNGTNVTLTLDDGETLTVARDELHQATAPLSADLADAA